MADKQSTQGNSGAEQVFGKAMARVGLSFDPATPQQVKKALDPVQRYIKDFNKNTDIKNTFFGKMPGLKKTMQSLVPDNMRFLQNMIAIGNASKSGADGMDFYNNQLGFLGKGLVNLTSTFVNTGEGATAMGKMVAAGASMATLGIAALIALGIALLQGIKNIITAGIDWQNQLNDFNKIMGGTTFDRVSAFNDGLNNSVKALGQYGFSFSEVTNTVKAYMVSGLNPTIALQTDLIKTTQMLSEVTGTSSTELASFFSGLMRGSKISASNLNALSGSFTQFNKEVERTGILGPIAFSDVQEAVTSTGTALLIASNKGKKFTDTMMNDLVSLTGLTKALNISVSDLNAKFEEAGNLISSQESGFRSLLAISGGANIQNLLSNQFNKTEAILKVSSQLQSLNAQFHGNLNILGQVAEQSFGLSKDVAIKLATMSSAQRKALQQAKEDSEKMHSDSLAKSYKSVTDTMTSAWDRFKNVFINAFHRAFAGNSAVQGFLSKLGSMINRWTSEIGSPNSGFGKLVDRLTFFIKWVFENLTDWLDKLEPLLDNLIDWLDDVLKVFSAEGFQSGISKILGDAIGTLAEVTIKALGAAMPWWLKGALIGMIFGPAGALIGAGIGKLIDWFSSDDKDKEEKRKTALTDWSKSASKQIAEALSKNKREQERLEGLKDTDLIVGKNGQFTLAGLERLELATEEDQLKDANNQLLDANNTNLATLNTTISELNRKLSGTGVQLSAGQQQIPQAPPPSKTAIATRTVLAAAIPGAGPMAGLLYK